MHLHLQIIDISSLHFPHSNAIWTPPSEDRTVPHSAKAFRWRPAKTHLSILFLIKICPFVKALRDAGVLRKNIVLK
jgi:hypothetical protein